METMKDPKAARKDGDGIPVYELRFCVVGGRDIGVGRGANTGGTGKLRATEGLEITYYPSRRWFRVDDRNQKRPVYIPESWCTWEPLE